MRRTALFAALVLGFLAVQAGASRVHAEPRTLSFDRLSAGLTASGVQMTSPGGQSSFQFGPYATYSVTGHLSTAASGERDFARGVSVSKLGLRVLVMESERSRVYAGYSVTHASGAGFGLPYRNSGEAVVAGSYAAARRADGSTALWGLVQSGWDAHNDNWWLKVGLRWQALGGKVLL